MVAIPNDVLGCQAMYIIWSNVIRNTVKHSELTKLEKNLEITIKINDYEPCPDYVEIIIYTNVYRSKSFVDDLVNKRNVSFDGKIWVQDKDDRQGRLRDNSLGTIEMATCAAYLQKLAVVEVDNPKFKLFENEIFQEGKPKVVDGKLTPMIMYAFAQPNTEERLLDEKLFSLGYKFHLLRPKEVLVICCQPEVFGNQLISNFDTISLSKHGIEFVKPDRIIGNSFDHKFLAFAGNQSDFDSFKVNNSKMAGTLPKRQVLINQTTNFKNINEFVKECWNLWMDHYNKSFNVFSCHYDEKVHVFPEIPIENPDLNINLYNHHKSLACETDNKTITKLGDGNYHEMMCGHHWTTKNLLEFLMKKRFSKSPYAQPYLESVFTNIIVIDERIQKSIVVHTKKYADKIPFDIYFNQLGVFIPSQKDGDPDLNRTNLMEEKEKIKIFIQKHIDKSDFVVIHLGILEKLLVDKSNKSDISIDVVINELIFNKKNRKKVVITSGRGKANNVNPDISFVPISLIQNAIETTFDKFRLVQILYNSRKSI
ncbi:MAG: hypothetical protein NTY07_20355 [Bacteroidia bacterium]|nr:hypothetical protein [Bacteroidia bacterium]